MKSKVHRQTKRCIYCGKPAAYWTGAVRAGREWVLAGWCKRCTHHSLWFHGEYHPNYGIESTNA